MKSQGLFTIGIMGLLFTFQSFVTNPNPNSSLNGYVVVQTRNLDKLISTTQDRMKKGWKPQGGITTYQELGEHQTVYIQVLIR